jgi:hypothetical protein
MIDSLFRFSLSQTTLIAFFTGVRAEILTRDAMTQPNRTIIDNSQLENHQLSQLTTALGSRCPRESMKISLKKYESALGIW